MADTKSPLDLGGFRGAAAVLSRLSRAAALCPVPGDVKEADC
jgi:hypothetical protein